MNQQIQEILLDQIDCRPQVRTAFEPEALAGMAKTIKNCGVQQPIRVRRDGERFVVVVGERRVRASRLAGLTTIPAVVEERELNETALTRLQLIENLQRENLSPLEQATGIRKLIDQSGATATQVAAELGISGASVARWLPLLFLSPAIQAKVESGEIPPSAAYELSRIKDLAQQAELAAQFADGRLTRDALSGAVKARNRSAANPAHGSKPSSRITARLSGNRAITLAGTGLATIDDFINWLGEALDRARKARTQGVALATFIRMLKDTAEGGQGGRA